MKPLLYERRILLLALCAGLASTVVALILLWSGGYSSKLQWTLTVLMAEGSQVRASDLGLRPARESAIKLDEMSIEDVERVLIQKALARFGGNVSHASKALGLSRSALYRRLQKYSL